MRKVLSVVFTLLFVFGFLFIALPNSAQADEEEKAFGCCQFLFDGEPGGCLYPSDPESCGSGTLEGRYVEGADCDMETGLCTSNAKDAKDKTK